MSQRIILIQFVVIQNDEESLDNFEFEKFSHLIVFHAM